MQISNPERLLEFTAHYFGLSRDELRESTYDNAKSARSIIAHILRESKFSFKEIGGLINRSIASVYGMEESALLRIRTDYEFATDYENVKKTLETGERIVKPAPKPRANKPLAVVFPDPDGIRCSQCNGTFTPESFYSRGAQRGHETRCKKCHRIAALLRFGKPITVTPKRGGRYCPPCGRSLTEDSFWKNQNRCKECQREARLDPYANKKIIYGPPLKVAGYTPTIVHGRTIMKYTITDTAMYAVPEAV